MTNGWPKSARILVWTLVGLVGFWLALYEAGSLRAWHFAHQLGQDNPNLSLPPIPPPDSRVSDLDGARMERLGLSFQTPWKIIDQKEKDFAGGLSLVSPEGRMLILDSSGISKSSNRRWLQIRKLITTSFFGPGKVKSDYDLMAAEMQSTPEQVKWWGKRSTNARNTFLLGMKSTIVGDRPTSIYSMNFGALRGFQFGDPAIAPLRVKLDLFDGKDRHLEIYLSGSDRDHPGLSQGQVNAFVNSIRPLPLPAGSPSSN